jgi:hypothetical protein
MVKKDTVPEEVRLFMKTNFGNVPAAILSLFQAITGGDDWRNFVDPFLEHEKGAKGATNALIFSFYVLFAVLVMLNLVTGVFVEGAQRMIQEEKDSEMLSEVKKLFNVADVDTSGHLSFEEFKNSVDSSSLSEFLTTVDLGSLDPMSLFQLLDFDGSGEVDVQEFVQGCMRLRGPARSVDLNALKHDFDNMASSWSESLQQLDRKINVIAGQVADIGQAQQGENRQGSKASVQPGSYKKRNSEGPMLLAMEQNIRLILGHMMRLDQALEQATYPETSATRKRVTDGELV